MACVAVLIVAWASIEIELIEKCYGVSQILMLIALASFVLCGFVIVLNTGSLRHNVGLSELNTASSLHFVSRAETLLPTYGSVNPREYRNSSKIRLTAPIPETISLCEVHL